MLCTDPKELVPSNSTCPHGGEATCAASPDPNHSTVANRGFGQATSGEVCVEPIRQPQRSPTRQQLPHNVRRRILAPKYGLRARTSTPRSGSTELVSTAATEHGAGWRAHSEAHPGGIRWAARRCLDQPAPPEATGVHLRHRAGQASLRHCTFKLRIIETRACGMRCLANRKKLSID